MARELVFLHEDWHTPLDFGVVLMAIRYDFHNKHALLEESFEGGTPARQHTVMQTTVDEAREIIGIAMNLPLDTIVCQWVHHDESRLRFILYGTSVPLEGHGMDTHTEWWWNPMNGLRPAPAPGITLWDKVLGDDDKAPERKQPYIIDMLDMFEVDKQGSTYAITLCGVPYGLYREGEGDLAHRIHGALLRYVTGFWRAYLRSHGLGDLDLPSAVVRGLMDKVDKALPPPAPPPAPTVQEEPWEHRDRPSYHVDRLEAEMRERLKAP